MGYTGARMVTNSTRKITHQLIDDRKEWIDPKKVRTKIETSVSPVLHRYVGGAGGGAGMQIIQKAGVVARE